jgi:thiol-disulfide isomerase/thioredoxin
MRETSAAIDGDALQSFERARTRSLESGHPIFLYWGTKWCPPCAEMQTTVLQRAQFSTRHDRMVPLMMDGDAPGAQVCGERVDVLVYPSMLILDHEAREWISLPCGLDAEQFCSVIDAALRTRSPMARLVDLLYQAEGKLGDDALALLAYHYWPQERRIRAGAERLELLERLDSLVLRRRPDLASRTLIMHLIARPGDARQDSEASASLRSQLYDRLLALLDSGNGGFSTLYYLLVGMEPVIDFLCENDQGRHRDLTLALQRVIGELVANETLSWTERLIAQSANLTLDAPTGAGNPLANRTRTLVETADAATTGQIERQSVMNMAGHLLRQSALREESIRVFRREIDRSPWPTYFMPYVAEMYMEQGESEEAFRWWRRSYEETQGKTTRFELGVRYIEARVRHAPKERAPIESMVARLLAERGDDADTTRGRMRRYLGLLVRVLGEWRA